MCDSDEGVSAPEKAKVLTVYELGLTLTISCLSEVKVLGGVHPSWKLGSVYDANVFNLAVQRPSV